MRWILEHVRNVIEWYMHANDVSIAALDSADLCSIE